MDLPPHPVAQRAVDELLSLHPAQTLELTGDDDSAVVAASVSRACMTHVEVGLVDDFDEVRCKSPAEVSFNR